MRADVDRLRRDHQRLRRTLAALDTAAARLPDTRFVVRDLCVALAKQLPRHADREARACYAARAAHGAGPSPDALAAAHADDGRRLDVLVSRFLIDREAPPAALRRAVAAASLALDERMRAQEAELFPWLDAQEPDAAAVDLSTSSLQAERLETVTVNHMIAEHPETRSVFECLFVNVAYEGYDSLDEVAARRGMEAGELFDRLGRPSTGQHDNPVIKTSCGR